MLISCWKFSGTEVILNGRCLEQTLTMGVIIWKVINVSSSAFNFKYALCTAMWTAIDNLHTRALNALLWLPQTLHCTGTHVEKVHKKTMHWANFTDLIQKFSTTSSVGGDKSGPSLWRLFEAQCKSCWSITKAHVRSDIQQPVALWPLVLLFRGVSCEVYTSRATSPPADGSTSTDSGLSRPCGPV